MKSYIKNLALLFIVVVTAILVFIYSGWYQIGADTRHNKLTYWALETLRDHSVARAASEIQRPADLESSARLLRGGPDYNEMCVSCHLAPGKSSTDFTKGLYPKPPDLTRKPSKTLNEKQLAQRRFWIIKHGIKQVSNQQLRFLLRQGLLRGPRDFASKYCKNLRSPRVC
jgi:cytochrome c553